MPLTLQLILGLVLALFVALVLTWLTLDGHWTDLRLYLSSLFPAPALQEPRNSAGGERETSSTPERRESFGHVLVSYSRPHAAIYQIEEARRRRELLAAATIGSRGDAA